MNHIKKITEYFDHINENVINKIKTTKALYKSTYKGYAFNRNKEYIIDHEDEKYIYIIDNMGHAFNFSKVVDGHSYFIGDYFNLKEVELKLSSSKYNI